MHARDTDGGESACGRCALVGRRSFLAKTLGAVAAAAALLPGVVRAEEMAGYLLVAAPPRSDGTLRYPVPPADGATIDVGNEVILVRTGGRCMAFALSCPHQRAMLRLTVGDTAFRCPKHKSEYRLDGAYIRGRATRSMDRLEIAREGEEIVVYLGVVIRSDTEPAKWAAASVTI